MEPLRSREEGFWSDFTSVFEFPFYPQIARTAAFGVSLFPDDFRSKNITAPPMIASNSCCFKLLEPFSWILLWLNLPWGVLPIPPAVDLVSACGLNATDFSEFLFSQFGPHSFVKSPRTLKSFTHLPLTHLLDQGLRNRTCQFRFPLPPQ